MSLTVFLAICILGCDVLIYFLYEWAFGESERIRKRQARSSRLCATSEQVRDGGVSRMAAKPIGRAPVIEMKRRNIEALPAPTGVSAQENLAYRRLVASFATSKPRT